jgi:hypothetical protein
MTEKPPIEYAATLYVVITVDRLDANNKKSPDVYLLPL